MDPEEELEPSGVERGKEVCQTSEKVRMLIGKAEPPQLKKGMQLKLIKQHVERLYGKNKCNLKNDSLARCRPCITTKTHQPAIKANPSLNSTANVIT